MSRKPNHKIPRIQSVQGLRRILMFAPGGERKVWVEEGSRRELDLQFYWRVIGLVAKGIWTQTKPHGFKAFKD